MKKILDQFAHLDVSRQRKWQLRKKSQHKCLICGKPEVMKGLCEKHYKRALDYVRERLGVKKFFKNTKFNRLKVQCQSKTPAIKRK
jgi:hypothetical protein